MKDTIQAAQTTPMTNSIMPRKSDKKGLIIALKILSIPSTIFPIKEIPFEMAFPGEKKFDLIFFF
jgi:hypothetical protein